MSSDFFLLIDCISGLYGKECNLNCSQFCHEKLCYQTTGECVNGCEDGYLGGLCTIRKILALLLYALYWFSNNNMWDKVGALFWCWKSIILVRNFNDSIFFKINYLNLIINWSSVSKWLFWKKVSGKMWKVFEWPNMWQR